MGASGFVAFNRPADVGEFAVDSVLEIQIRVYVCVFGGRGEGNSDILHRSWLRSFPSKTGVIPFA